MEREHMFYRKAYRNKYLLGDILSNLHNLSKDIVERLDYNLAYQIYVLKSNLNKIHMIDDEIFLFKGELNLFREFYNGFLRGCRHSYKIQGFITKTVVQITDDLVLLEDGTVHAWDKKYSVPNFVKRVVQISGTRINNNLLLLEDGTVKGLSYIKYGGLLGTRVDQIDHVDIPNFNKPVVQVDTSLNHYLALLQNGTVVAWGCNDHGQCDVPKLTKRVVQINAGDKYSLALLEDGTLRAWGDLNIQDIDKRVVKIFTGNYSVALLEDGTIRGLGDVIDWDMAAFPDPDTKIIDIAIGPDVCLLVLEDESIISLWSRGCYCT